MITDKDLEGWRTDELEWPTGKSDRIMRLISEVRRLRKENAVLRTAEANLMRELGR